MARDIRSTRRARDTMRGFVYGFVWALMIVLTVWLIYLGLLAMATKPLY